MFLYKFLRFIIRPLAAILFPTKVINKENFIDTRAVVICNHYSLVDSVMIGVKFLKRSINAVAKKEAFSNKFIGNIFEKIGAIPVDRDAPGLKTHKKIMNVLKNDDILLIFPEGTRNLEGDKKLAPFKHGAGLYAVKGQAIVIPMLYHQPPKMFRKNYLIVGKPIHLDYYYGKHSSQIKEAVTELLTEKMNDLRRDLDMYIDKKGSKKVYCS